MWTCERWPTLSGRCQVSFKEAGEEGVGPQVPSTSFPLPFPRRPPSPCLLLPDPDRLLEPRWKPAAVHCIGGATDLLLIIPTTLW